MQSIILASALVGLAGAAAAPQNIDFDLAYALPNPSYTTVLDATAQIVTYNPSTVFSAALPQITASDTTNTLDTTTEPALEKRAACAPQPTGAGPIPTSDTVSAFAALPAFSSAAVGAPVPSGYTQTFSNLNASNNAYGYMGYTNLKSYDSNLCASKCNAINGCISFNLFFERDPSLEPGSGASGCANPASTTNIKCVFWGGPVSTDNALNSGQWRNQFQVAIAGSNGYVNNTVALVPGYGAAIPLGNAAINSPYDKFGFDSYMGSSIFIGAFNAQLCADACTKKSEYAIAHPPTDGTPVQTCQFFNTYILYINTTKNIQGQYCAMYSESWPASYATNVGQYRGSDHFLLQYSFAYSNSTNPGSAQPLPAVHQAKRDILWPANSALPYCSSLLGYTTPLTTTTATATTTTSTTTIVTTTTTVTPGGNNARRSAAAIAQPQVLTKYPASIVSSACSLAATPVTQTSTITTITTAATATTTVTSTSTVVTTTPAGRLPGVPCDPAGAGNGNFNAGGCNNGCFCNADVDQTNAYCGRDCGPDGCTVCRSDSECPSGTFCDIANFGAGFRGDYQGVCYSFVGCTSTYSPPAVKRNSLSFMAAMPRKGRTAPVAAREQTKIMGTDPNRPETATD